MKYNNIKVAVTSSSFSNHPILRKLIMKHFANVSFNSKGNIEEGALIPFLKGHEAAIIGLDRITHDVVESLRDLRVIAKYGVGVDNIDIDALRSHGIYFGWTPGVNALSVAELTLCFMIGLIRNVFRSSYMLKDMQWRKEGGQQLSGKTVGIIGCGNVGKAVITLLKPFGCKVIVNDIVNYDKFYREHKIQAVSFETVMKKSNIVSLHVPLDESTKGIINERTLKLMRKDSFLINTSRGGVVWADALKRALKEDWISGAALDVFEPEPPVDEELVCIENLVVSPHIGGTSDEAVYAMGRSAVDHLVDYFSRE